MTELNVEILKATNFVWNDPVQYNEYITIYPVSIKEYRYLMFALDSLQIIKEDYANTQDVMYNIKVVQMSNLEFLVSQMSSKEDADLASVRFEQFRLVFYLCFHIELEKYEYFFDENQKIVLLINDLFFLKHSEFDDLRNLICYQHIPDYNDAYVSKDMRDEIRKTEELHKSKSGYPSFEERVTSYCVHVNRTRQDLSDISIREFLVHEAMYQSIEDYKIYKQADMSGMVEFKKPIEHYLFRKKKSQTEGYLIDLDSFKSQINQNEPVAVKK